MADKSSDEEQIDKGKAFTKLTESKLNRRSFMGGLAALGLSGLGAAPLSFSARPTPLNPTVNPENIIIRNGHVLTMDAETGDLPSADVLISGGEISAVGEKLEAPADAEEVDARGMIVLPGFVETHWHIWNSLMRSLIGNKPGVGYFEMKKIIGPHFRPQDTYASTRFAVSEALHAGITTLHDWSHNVRGPAYAEASLRALNELGIRGRFSQGVAANKGPAIDLELLERLHQTWADYANEGMLQLGLAWEGLTGEESQRKKEVARAREMGLPISVHADTIEQFEGLLGSDFQIIHAMKTSGEEFKKLADTGASVSSSPFSEMRIGYGLPPVVDMLNSGVNIGLSVDTTPLSGNADMFALMKVFLNLANGMAQDQFEVSPRRILEIATIEGARSLGMEQSIGSLVPGKRADIILVSLNDINLGVLTDPENLLTLSGLPSNVDTVLVDGKFRKRRGSLIAAEPEAVTREASESLDFLLKQSGW